MPAYTETHDRNCCARIRTQPDEHAPSSVFKDKSLPWRQPEVLAEGIVASGSDVHSRFSSGVEFRVARGMKRVLNVLPVDYHEHTPAFIRPVDDIHASERHKLSHAAFRYNLVSLPPVQQSAQPVEHVVFRQATPLSCEGVVLVARESAGKILAHVAVGKFLSSVSVP